MSKPDIEITDLTPFHEIVRLLGLKIGAAGGVSFSTELSGPYRGFRVVLILEKLDADEHN